ncbi:hypothetical protein [Tomitella fengzijianii]|uniref:Uncharacterized protein n=1 Tax=Tomitella fengzijianii TaxID=2597660 RepID=A0A516X3C2_9ACTN|nr:hypothetical protein [Tomitella fengzijianii]QDQ97557.1 hypothetical protein FO059_09715 [Tomitella fengzijianii]
MIVLADGAVNVNLVAPAEVRPKLQRLLLIAVGVGVILGMFFGVNFTWWAGVIVALVIAVPLVVIAVAGLRRNQSIEGTVLTSRSGPTRVVDLATAGSVAITVNRSRVDQAMLRADNVAVTLAVYSGERGRELPIDSVAALERGLREADTLARHEVIEPEADGSAGASVPDGPATMTELADLLKAHLRAEAVGTPLPERPLYKAIQATGGGGHAGATVTSAQVRAITG